MRYLIGQAPEAPCPVCDLSPVALAEIDNFPEVAECARCGFPFTIRNHEGERLARAVPSVSSSLANVLRRYYEETGRKLPLPSVVIENPEDLDPEQAARNEALDEWLRPRPHLLSGAMAPATWPYVSMTAFRLELDGRPVWQVIAPPASVPMQVLVPIPPENLPPGSIVTISIPIDPFATRSDEEPEPTGAPPC